MFKFRERASEKAERNTPLITDYASFVCHEKVTSRWEPQTHKTLDRLEHIVSLLCMLCN